MTEQTNFEKLEEGTLKTLRLMWELAELEVLTNEVNIYLGSVVTAFAEIMLYSDEDLFQDFLLKVREEFYPRREAQIAEAASRAAEGLDDFLSKLLDN